MPLASGPYLGWKGRPYQAQEIVIIISPFHNKKETATCRIHGLHGVAEAEEAEQGLELGIVGSMA